MDSSHISPDLRQLAELLASAMYDWRTPDLESIPQFVHELSNYFGQPITKRRLKAVPFSGVNGWELECAATLDLMLTQASKLFKVSNIEDAIEKLLASLRKEL
jgi:hypothetical protein